MKKDSRNRDISAKSRAKESCINSSQVSDDSEVRGGKLPMIFVLLIPERIPVDNSRSYKEFIENTIGNYNLNKVIDYRHCRKIQ